MASRDVQLDAEHPWPGLESYPESGRAFFHGRDDEIVRLLGLVDAHPLVLLYGESGLGKTSLLQAGVFPRLRERHVLPVLVRLDHAAGATSLPTQVMLALASALDAAAIDGPRPTEGERLWEYFHRTETLLWSPAQELVTPLIVFDQFEELLTLGGGIRQPAVRDFVDEVGELVLDRPPARVASRLEAFDRSRPGPHVLFSFREEFLAEVEELQPQFGPQLQRRLRLGPLEVERATETVARAGKALVTPEVARVIAQSVAGGRPTVEPSLLSVYCRELNATRLARGGREITPALVREAGATVLPAFYARSVADVGEPVLAFVEERLLTEGERRNIVTLEEALAAPGVSRAALEQLVSRRIIRIEERFGAERVELMHDVLAPIVGEARKGRRARREELRLAEELEAQRAESVRLDGERRRWRRMTMGAVVLAVVAVGATVAAVVQRGQARRAERQQLALRADAMVTGMRLSSTLRDSIGHLAAAVELGPDSEAAATGLLLALRGLAPPLVGFSHDGAVRVAVFGPDGGRVATASEDGTARVWDARTGAPVGAPLRHGGVVRSVSFSRDGARVVTASNDRTARVWNTQTGAPLSAPLRHDAEVTSAEFSPDGARVVTASVDGTARVWNSHTGARIGAPLVHEIARRSVVLERYVTSARFSSDGTRVLTTSVFGTARVWNARTGAPITAPLRLGSEVNSVAFSPDGARVVASSLADHTTRVWDVRTGAPVTKVMQHGARVTSAAFSQNGTWVLTSSQDRTVRVWDAQTGAPVTAPLQHEGAVISAHFSRDGARVVTTSYDPEYSRSTVRVWDARTGATVSAQMWDEDAVSSTAFSPDGSWVVTATKKGPTKVWSAKTVAPKGARLGRERRVSAAVFGSDGGSIVTASFDGTARVWDARTGAAVTAPLRHEGAVKSAAFSRDGSMVATVSSSFTRIFDARTGALMGPPLGPAAGVSSATFSPDGTRLLTASTDGTARAWETATSAPVGPPLKHNNGIISASFSPDGDRAVTASFDGAARVWDVRTGAPVTAPLRHHSWVTSAEFSPDGARVVTASLDSTARVWDARTGAPVSAPLRHHLGVSSAAFSLNGARVVTASYDRTARVWDARTGAPLGAPLRHGLAVTWARFSPDGTRVVTVSEGSARVWDAGSGAQVGPPIGYEGDVGSAAFSPDGARLVTVSHDGAARVWDARTVDRAHRADLVDLATTVVGGRIHGLLDFVPMPPAEQFRRLADWRRRAAGWANAPDGSFEQWVHWYFSDPATRPDQPGLWRSSDRP